MMKELKYIVVMVLLLLVSISSYGQDEMSRDERFARDFNTKFLYGNYEDAMKSATLKFGNEYLGYSHEDYKKLYKGLVKARMKEVQGKKLVLVERFYYPKSFSRNDYDIPVYVYFFKLGEEHFVMNYIFEKDGVLLMRNAEVEKIVRFNRMGEDHNDLDRAIKRRKLHYERTINQ